MHHVIDHGSMNCDLLVMHEDRDDRHALDDATTAEGDDNATTIAIQSIGVSARRGRRWPDFQLHHRQ